MEKHRLLPPHWRERSLRDHCAWARRTPEASVTLPPPSSHRHDYVAKGPTAHHGAQRRAEAELLYKPARRQLYAVTTTKYVYPSTKDDDTPDNKRDNAGDTYEHETFTTHPAPCSSYDHPYHYHYHHHHYHMSGWQSMPGLRRARRARFPDATLAPRSCLAEYRPSNPDYVKKNITGLLCHTVVDSYLKFAVPAGCDFFIADVSIAVPTRHPRYWPYMATVNLKSATQKQAVMQRMQLAPGKGLILMVNRSALRPKNPQARPQAIVRGILQIVTDINADGVGLTDQSLRESDVQEVRSDADILSDEMRQYHGLYRHESYTGSYKGFKDLITHVAMKSSLVFVYRVFGRATYFSAPYYTNFFMEKKNDTPVSEYIKQEVIVPLSQKQGNKAVALSMSLRVRKCAKYSLDGDQPPKCTELPLDFQHICDISTANFECHFYSLMTRRWKGGLDEDLTDIHFFEVEETVSRKARLMADQLKKAGIKTIGIIVEHYEYDADKTVMTYSHDKQRNVSCKVTPFGITNRTKAQLGKVL
nr:uncharacterized protein LOC126540216 [Dermacentor andersoni]